MTAANILGFSKARLERIDRFLQERYIESGRFPCAQLVITRRGEVAHQSVLGWQDAERKKPLAKDTVFRIYSMTKPITAVAFMTLVEEGRVALEDPVSKYIPEWANLGVFRSGVPGNWVTQPLARPMQVVDLLRHTSGLTYSSHGRTVVDAAYKAIDIERTYGGLDLAGLIRTLATFPLDFSPGEAWNYSLSTDVLGYIIEKVTGMPLDKAFQTIIFDPLKMTDTGFQVRPDQRARFGACYMLSPGGGFKLQDDPETSPCHGRPTMFSGGAGLVSTAADYLRFCHMLLNGGTLDGARILGPQTVKLIASNHLPGGGDLTQHSRSMFSESTNAGVGFGLGFAVAFDPVRAMLPSSVGEYYWGGFASTAFWIDPVEEICVVFMTQFIPSSATPIRRELRTMIYAALMEPKG